jgi:hypothetical protein
VGAGRIEPDLHVFHNPLRSERILKIKIRNPHSEWSTRWALGSADWDGFMRVRVFFFFFMGRKPKKLFTILLTQFKI